MFQGIGGVGLVHHARYPQEPYNEWSFELVVKKTAAGGASAELTDDGISLLVPTLNRPKDMEVFAVNVDATTKDPSHVEIIFGIHGDDPASIAKAGELSAALKVTVRCEIISRYSDGKAHLTYFWNQLYERAHHPILGFFGDDVVFKTPGWDEDIRQEFSKSKTVMVLCNDVTIKRGKEATLFFTHKVVHEKVGYYLYPKFRRWFMDTFWDLVYRSEGKLIYKEGIITEHLCPDIFINRRDTTYNDMQPYKDSDKLVWQSPETRTELDRAAGILRSIE